MIILSFDLLRDNVIINTEIQTNRKKKKIKSLTKIIKCNYDRNVISIRTVQKIASQNTVVTVSHLQD